MKKKLYYILIIFQFWHSEVLVTKSLTAKLSIYPRQALLTALNDFVLVCDAFCGSEMIKDVREIKYIFLLMKYALKLAYFEFDIYNVILSVYFLTIRSFQKYNIVNDTSDVKVRSSSLNRQICKMILKMHYHKF